MVEFAILCTNVAENTNGYSMSEDLKGAIIGAVLAFGLTCIYDIIHKIIGRVVVVKLRSVSEIKRSKTGEIEQIEVHANVLCENHKMESASIYAWKAIIHTDCGVYDVELRNLCSDSEYKYLDVITLNRYQTVQCILNGTLDLKTINLLMNHNSSYIRYKDIEKVKEIERIEIQYQSSRSNKILTAKES